MNKLMASVCLTMCALGLNEASAATIPVPTCVKGHWHVPRHWTLSKGANTPCTSDNNINRLNVFAFKMAYAQMPLGADFFDNQGKVVLEEGTDFHSPGAGGAWGLNSMKTAEICPVSGPWTNIKNCPIT